MKNVHVIILAGGSGTRFWPLSRKTNPKQLLSLVTKHSLLADTIKRNKKIAASIAISTGKHLEKPIKKAFPKTKLIVEPEKRDTAAAFGFCAMQYKPDDILVFVHSDHQISPQSKYEAAIKKAIKIAREGEDIVTVGIKPTFPSTGYGYIKPLKGGYATFKEKPALETATKFVKQGYYWNAGMFIVKQQTLMDMFAKHSPQTYKYISKLTTKANVKKYFSKIPKMAFDFAVMDHAKNIRYVKSAFKWNDIGSFDALETIHRGKNTVVGKDPFVVESKGNIVVSDKPVALVHCEDLVIVDTEDTLLVVPKDKVEKVKALQGLLPEKLK